MTGKTQDTNPSIGSPTKFNWNDATWILTSSFIIFTMQTGFSLLQSGFVRKKNQVSMMFKTTIDPIICGVTYWFIAYGLTEESEYSNEFIGAGSFLVDSVQPGMGQLFANFAYKLSIMSTATNIVMSAMAERVTFALYFGFAALISIAFALPNYWVQSPKGFLHSLGVVDIAGCSVIHLAGGTAGLVSTIMLKPRIGRFDKPIQMFPMSDPTNALLGTYMLWWGWVGFHMASTFGVSLNRWIYCSRAAVCTILSSSVGGITAIALSALFYNRQINIKIFIAGLLSGLVAISGGCTLFTSSQAFFVGLLGSILSIATIAVLKQFQIDDPVNSIAIHLPSSIWGMLAVGLFVERDALFNPQHRGFLRSGSFVLLGVQILSILLVMAWSALMAYLILRSLGKFIPIRIDYRTELSGVDQADINNINTDLDVDSILAPNFDSDTVIPKVHRKENTRRRLRKVTRAIMAVNRFLLISATQRKHKNESKAFNTKLISQLWSTVPSIHSGGSIEVRTSSNLLRPKYIQPHA